MKKYKLIFVLLVLCSAVYAQKSGKKLIKGKVEYISSQFYYIRFTTTNGINAGDTLYIKSRKKYIRKFIVKSKSSRSCAAVLIGSKVKLNRNVYAFVRIKITEPKKKEPVTVSSNKLTEKSAKNSAKIYTSSVAKKIRRNEKSIYGRLSISGYSNISNIPGQQDYQHWRHSFSFYANHINGSRFSISNYISFRYRADQWSRVQNNIGTALKIYDLSFKYDLSRNSYLLLGRKINPNLSNIGAIDGIQMETKINDYKIGGIFGSRPNLIDYGYNFKLLQFGGYISRTDSLGSGQMQNTISAIQQMNDYTTDRRFIYLQHSNNIIRKVYLFFSSEIDLFRKVHNNSQNDFRLTSLYLSLRYSPKHWLSLSASYDARKNVIYYETFKNYIDQLIDNATRQGFRFRVNIRPVNYLFASFYTGYRFRNSDIKPTRNFGGSITYSRLPFINASLNTSFIKLMTNYLDGSIFGLRLSKDLFRGLVYSTIGYRKVNYSFATEIPDLNQNIFLLDLSFRIARKISFSISYEGTFEGITSYSNVYANFTTRF